MTISVIVPVYNVEDYLVECIDSVLQQTYINFELIMIDDGSTDKSGLICDRYNEKRPEQIKTIHVQNGGPLRARMLGFKESSGEVLLFLDGDDCLRVDALEKIAHCFEEDTCDMVMFNTGECTHFSTISVKHSLKSGQFFEGQSKKDLYRKLIRGEIPNSICLKAIRRKCVVFPDSLLQSKLKHGEDLLLSAYFITNCERIVYLNEALYHYRNRPGSAVRSFDVSRKESIKIVHTELDKCIDKWNKPEFLPLHNARKVKGWVDNFLLLIMNKKQIGKSEFKKELRLMSNDPYFRDAYKNMKKSTISYKYRIIAFLLYYNRLYK